MIKDILAAGVVWDDGTVAVLRGCTIARNGVGDYTITLEKAVDYREVKVNLTLLGLNVGALPIPPWIQRTIAALVDPGAPGVVYIGIMDPATGLAADAAFDFEINHIAVNGAF